MRILIVGGTVFVGRALTTAALSGGHTVTLLNRGRTQATPAPGVEQLTCDRNADLDLLRTREWDAVIDTCAYYPRQVRTLLSVLSGQPHYTLISTISAYADHSRPGLQEHFALAEPLFNREDPIAAGNYGRLKSACEMVTVETIGSRALIVRPGIIVGPHDPTGRFAYWLRRLAGSAPFIAPADGNDPLQVIDVRDLAEWVMALVSQRTVGAYNAVGPCQPLCFRDFLSTGLQVFGSRAQPVWIEQHLLENEKVTGRLTLPLWMPRTEARAGGVFSVDGSKAWAKGLGLRPLADSIADSHCYESTVQKPVVIGVSPDDEQALLQRLGRQPAG